MVKKKVTKKRVVKEDRSGVLFPAGLFIGIGIGLLVGNVAAWTLLGMALGFIMMWWAKK